MTSYNAVAKAGNQDKKQAKQSKSEKRSNANYLNLGKAIKKTQNEFRCQALGTFSRWHIKKRGTEKKSSTGAAISPKKNQGESRTAVILNLRRT